MISQCRLDAVVTPLAQQVQHSIKQQITRIERLITHTQERMLPQYLYLALARTIRTPALSIGLNTPTSSFSLVHSFGK